MVLAETSWGSFEVHEQPADASSAFVAVPGDAIQIGPDGAAATVTSVRRAANEARVWLRGTDGSPDLRATLLADASLKPGVPVHVLFQRGPYHVVTERQPGGLP